MLITTNHINCTNVSCKHVLFKSPVSVIYVNSNYVGALANLSFTQGRCINQRKSFFIIQIRYTWWWSPIKEFAKQAFNSAKANARHINEVYNNPLHRHHDKVKAVVDQTTNKVSDEIYNKGTPELDKVMKDRGDAADTRRHKKSIKNYDDGIKREAEEAQAREERKESVSPPSPGPSEFEAGVFKAPDKAFDSSDIDFKRVRDDKIFDPSRRPPDSPGGGQFDADYHLPVPTLKLPQKRVKSKVVESTEVSETGNSDNTD